MAVERIRIKFGAFRELLDHNFRAIEQLASIRLGLEDSRHYDAEASFYKSIKSAEAMTEAYGRLSGISGARISGYRAKLDEVASMGAGYVTRFQYAKRFNYDSTDVMARASNGLFESVESLTEPFYVSANPKFALENVSTLHDFVRYVHQNGLDAMFEEDARDLENAQQYKLGGLFNLVYFRIQNLGEGLKTEERSIAKKDISCTPLEVIIESCESFVDRKPSGAETINAIIDRDYLNAHFNLGCHSADLTALLNERDSYVDLAYNESGYPNSSRRAAYIGRCLDSLGFKVKAGRQLKATLRDKSKHTASNALRETARALLTCRDLDLDGYLDNDDDVEAAFSYFKAGGANPKQILKARHTIEVILANDIEFNEALAQLEHSLKPRLKSACQNTIDFMQKYLSSRLNSKFPEYTELETTTHAILTGEYLTPKPKRMLDGGYKFGIGSIYNNDLIKNIGEYKLIKKIDKMSKTIYNLYNSELIKKNI